MSESVTASERVIGEVRWLMRGDAQILQQMWEITTYKMGAPFARQFEWRDVPILEHA